MALLLVAACTGGGEGSGATPSPTPTPSPDPDRPVTLTYGVWGSDAEIAAHEKVVADYNAETEDVRVELRTFPHRRAAARARAQGEVADVFLADRRDMASILEQGLNQPVNELLDERGVEFGDGHHRMGLVAFSSEDGLQCMPYGTSPMVIYYNTELLDFERMARRGLEEIEPGSWWGFDAFVQAAEFASRPRRGIRGLAVEPSLTTFGPLLRSGGGSLFDDENEPTSLAFSSEESREALEPILELLRDPQVTPQREELERQGALGMFKSGEAAMVMGFRDLVPELRRTRGLSFDVMPMPTLEERATLGQMTGACLSADPADLSAAADFLVHVISAESVAKLARTGGMVPANLEVSASADFMQPDRQPAAAYLYTAWIRYIGLLPLLDNYRQLERRVRPMLADLLHEPVLSDLEAATTEIDEASTGLITGPEEGEESPSEGASEEETP